MTSQNRDFKELLLATPRRYYRPGVIKAADLPTPAKIKANPVIVVNGSHFKIGVQIKMSAKIKLITLATNKLCLFMLLLELKKYEKLIARKACIERMKPIINGNVGTTISARDKRIEPIRVLIRPLIIM
ncbi:hypothetical protein [Sphingobacterium sp. N143]|uniref:hypothetical protein n=1 Tax=Sphingobacterium sp. N143 TaxID=2746727 RepID=UPI0025748FDD|nr:hypothetical protein [Sphingobacterium sp. N143]